MHGVLERWAKEEANCRELYELLRSVREEEGGKLPEVPDIIVEECHICLLCNGGKYVITLQALKILYFQRPQEMTRKVSISGSSVRSCTVLGTTTRPVSTARAATSRATRRASTTPGRTGRRGTRSAAR